MADLVITAANVALGGSNCVIEKVQAGEGVTQGWGYYLNTSDSKMYGTDGDAATSAVFRGIVITPAATDGYFIGVRSGPVIIGATVTVGLGYYISLTKGGIAVIGDLGSGDFPTFIGFATTAAIIYIDPVIATVAKA